MRCRLRGKWWTIARRRMRGRKVGECDSPANSAPRYIYLKPSLKDKELLETLLHEMLHACLWDLDEDAVIEVSADIASSLWSDGWRRDCTH